MECLCDMATIRVEQSGKFAIDRQIGYKLPKPSAVVLWIQPVDPLSNGLVPRQNKMQLDNGKLLYRIGSRGKKHPKNELVLPLVAFFGAVGLADGSQALKIVWLLFATGFSASIIIALVRAHACLAKRKLQLKPIAANIINICVSAWHHKNRTKQNLANDKNWNIKIEQKMKSKRTNEWRRNATKKKPTQICISLLVHRFRACMHIFADGPWNEIAKAKSHRYVFTEDIATTTTAAHKRKINE